MGSPGSVGFGSRVAGFSPGSSGLRPTACRNRHGNCRISVLATVHRGSGPLGSGSSVLFRVSNSRIHRVPSRSLGLISLISRISLSLNLSSQSHSLPLAVSVSEGTRKNRSKKKEEGRREKEIIGKRRVVFECLIKKIGYLFIFLNH